MLPTNVRRSRVQKQKLYFRIRLSNKLRIQGIADNQVPMESPNNSTQEIEVIYQYKLIEY